MGELGVQPGRSLAGTWHLSRPPGVNHNIATGACVRVILIFSYTIGALT